MWGNQNIEHMNINDRSDYVVQFCDYLVNPQIKIKDSTIINKITK